MERKRTQFIFHFVQVIKTCSCLSPDSTSIKYIPPCTFMPIFKKFHMRHFANVMRSFANIRHIPNLKENNSFKGDRSQMVQIYPLVCFYFGIEIILSQHTQSPKTSNFLRPPWGCSCPPISLLLSGQTIMIFVFIQCLNMT